MCSVADGSGTNRSGSRTAPMAPPRTIDTRCIDSRYSAPPPPPCQGRLPGLCVSDSPCSTSAILFLWLSAPTTESACASSLNTSVGRRPMTSPTPLCAGSTSPPPTVGVWPMASPSCARRTSTTPPSSSSTSVREPSDSAAVAAEVLDGLGLRWALMGALAASRYRRSARLTTDADLLVEVADGVAEAFENQGYDVRAAGEDERRPDMLLVRGKGDRIDLLFATVEYLREALRRAVDGTITVEDVIVQKLIAWRPRD